jgi:uncharacterized protein
VKWTLFYPNYRFEKITDIDSSTLKSNQIKTLLIDIDNTIVEKGKTQVSDEIHEWVKKMSAEFECILISNNPSISAKHIAHQLSLEILHFAFKPFKSRYLVWSRHKEIKSKVMMIGDQIFTDVLFAKNIGAMSCLVKPISKNDHLSTRFLRKIENIILNEFTSKS